MSPRRDKPPTFHHFPVSDYPYALSSYAKSGTDVNPVKPKYRFKGLTDLMEFGKSITGGNEMNTRAGALSASLCGVILISAAPLLVDFVRDAFVVVGVQAFVVAAILLGLKGRSQK